MSRAKFRFEYAPSDRNKPKQNYAGALDTIRAVLSRVQPADIAREVNNAGGAPVRIADHAVTPADEPLALEIVFELEESMRQGNGNIVTVYRALQKIERRTDEYLYYLIRSEREDPTWFDRSGLKRNSDIVETRGFINKAERVPNRMASFLIGGAIGAVAMLYLLNYQTVNTTALGLIQSGG